MENAMDSVTGMITTLTLILLTHRGVKDMLV